MRVIVVGAGLFGSIIAAELSRLGHELLLIDSQEPDAGSNAAACLMRPSWLGSMGDKAVPALETLDRLYGLQTVRFRLRPSALHSDVHWIPPSSILGKATVIRGKVSSIERHGPEEWCVTHCDTRDQGWLTRRTFADRVIVAAGVWTGPILGYRALTERTVPQAGRAFLFEHAEIAEPFIKIWAPYKQIVAFNRGDGAWIGDGAAIIAKNWNDDVSRRNAERLVQGADDAGILPVTGPKHLFGLRPYVKDAKPLFMEQVNPGLWAVTGGAKNGTIAAGWAARHIGENL